MIGAGPCARLVAGFAALVAMALAGCAMVPADAGFSDVRSLAEQRVGLQPRWIRSPEDEKAAEQATRELLARPLDVDRAVQVALLNNRRLQAQYEELGVARANVLRAGLPRNPVLDATVQWSRGGGSRDLELGLTQDFLSLLFLPLKHGLAQTEFEATRLGVSAALIETAAEVRAAFIEAQAAEQLVELMRQVVTAVRIETDASRRLFQAGNITELAYLNSRALHEEMQLAFVRAEVDAATARENVNRLLGLWAGDTQWTMDARLPDLPADAADYARAEQQAVANNLDLAAARYRLAAMAKRHGVGYSEVFAPLEVGITRTREEDRVARGLSVEVAIPLFDFGQGTTALAQALVRQAGNEYTAQAIEVRSAARVAAQTLATAQASARHVHDVLMPLRTRVLEQTQLQYNAMQVGIFQLLQAKREQVEAGRRYIESLRDYWLARTALSQALAGRAASLRRTQPEVSGVRPGELPGTSRSEAAQLPER
jgi:cobalt-zinc-cadmium efflux system outer membrane protein